MTDGRRRSWLTIGGRSRTRVTRSRVVTATGEDGVKGMRQGWQPTRVAAPEYRGGVRAARVRRDRLRALGQTLSGLALFAGMSLLTGCGGDAPESGETARSKDAGQAQALGPAAPSSSETETPVDPAVEGRGVEPSPVVPDDVADQTIRQTFRCGDVLVEATFGDEAVVLENGEGQRRLPQVPAASGARYADALGRAFWARGDTARWTPGPASSLSAAPADEGGTLDCVVSPDERSPWAEGRERGLALRAIGQEPGWLLEVQMHGNDDGSGRALLVEQDGGMQVFDDVAWAPDGTLLRFDEGRYVARLGVPGAVCTDGMSGERMALSVVLVAPDGERSGCGRDYRHERLTTDAAR